MVVCAVVRGLRKFTWNVEQVDGKFNENLTNSPKFPRFSEVTHRGSTRSREQSSQTFRKQKPSQVANRKSNRKMTKTNDELCYVDQRFFFRS